MKKIATILIANRGEIARRIIRTCHRLGIRSVAVYSEADRHMPFVREADTALYLGAAPASDSYLDGEKILQAAKRSGADAIHPGYGFLSENAAFARSCAEEDLIFIGPNPEAIEAMGSKSKAKALMEAQSVPVIPGYRGADQSAERLLTEAEAIGYPVLLKASAGGGGKGMRIVRQPGELPEALEGARREAAKSFGDEELILEKYFPSARHIEFQIFGDRHGNAIHLLERECSLQRRYQKVVEESPSSVLSAETRARMGHDAVRAARALQYDNAGTVEFIYTSQGDYYFLEVNTRLQVEHPVTEAITGLDLVAWQIQVAEGKPLPLEQDDIRADGYAIECRLYAEDARNDFLPVTGTVHHWRAPELEGLRFDSAVESGTAIGIHYDPMIAKIIAHGSDRREAIRRMRYALDRLECLGLTTNLPFLQRLLDEPEVREGQYDTKYIGRMPGLDTLYDYPDQAYHQAAVGLTLFRWNQRKNGSPLPALPPGWRNNYDQPQEEEYRIVDSDWLVRYRYLGEGRFACTINDRHMDVRLLDAGDGRLRFELDGLQLDIRIVEADDWYFLHLPGTGQLIAQALPRFPLADTEGPAGGYQSPMPGEIVKVLVEPGMRVKSGDSLLILSSMKMENTIAAAEDGTVQEVYVEEGQHVEAGYLMLKMNGHEE